MGRMGVMGMNKVVSGSYKLGPVESQISCFTPSWPLPRLLSAIQSGTSDSVESLLDSLGSSADFETGLDEFKAGALDSFLEAIDSGGVNLVAAILKIKVFADSLDWAPVIAKLSCSDKGGGKVLDGSVAALLMRRSIQDKNLSLFKVLVKMSDCLKGEANSLSEEVFECLSSIVRESEGDGGLGDNDRFAFEVLTQLADFGAGLVRSDCLESLLQLSLEPKRVSFFKILMEKFTCLSDSDDVLNQKVLERLSSIVCHSGPGDVFRDNAEYLSFGLVVLNQLENVGFFKRPSNDDSVHGFVSDILTFVINKPLPYYERMLPLIEFLVFADSSLTKNIDREFEFEFYGQSENKTLLGVVFDGIWGIFREFNEGLHPSERSTQGLFDRVRSLAQCLCLFGADLSKVRSFVPRQLRLNFPFGRFGMSRLEALCELGKVLSLSQKRLIAAVIDPGVCGSPSSLVHRPREGDDEAVFLSIYRVMLGVGRLENFGALEAKNLLKPFKALDRNWYFDIPPSQKKLAFSAFCSDMLLGIFPGLDNGDEASSPESEDPARQEGLDELIFLYGGSTPTGQAFRLGLTRKVIRDWLIESAWYLRQKPDVGDFIKGLFSGGLSDGAGVEIGVDVAKAKALVEALRLGCGDSFESNIEAEVNSFVDNPLVSLTPIEFEFNDLIFRDILPEVILSRLRAVFLFPKPLFKEMFSIFGESVGYDRDRAIF